MNNNQNNPNQENKDKSQTPQATQSQQTQPVNPIPVETKPVTAKEDKECTTDESKKEDDKGSCAA